MILLVWSMSEIQWYRLHRRSKYERLVDQICLYHQHVHARLEESGA